MRRLILIAHDIRSTHNVGSLLRTADGLGVEKVYLTGYTPYPAGASDDDRLPHIAQKLDKQIAKTALGAEQTTLWQHHIDILSLLRELKTAGFTLVALEQHQNAISLPNYQPPAKLALLLGREVEGIDSILFSEVDQVIEIPMLGSKESYNVVQAAAMALYHCRFR